MTAGDVVLSDGGTAGGTVNLNGGTLTANRIIKGGGTGTRTLNFNGGLLRANTDAANFIEDLAMAANVAAPGAKIDTQAFNVAVPQVLQHDAAVSGADGGLTKTGTGCSPSAATTPTPARRTSTRERCWRTIRPRLGHRPKL